MPEPESLVSRLREMAADARAAAYGAHSIEQAGIANQRAEDLNQAANHIEELEAALSERSLLVEENERLRRVLALAEHRLRDEGMWLLHGSHDERAKVVAGWVDHLRSLTASQEQGEERPDEHVLRVIARDDQGRRYTFFVPLDRAAVNDTARQMLKESKPHDTAFLPSAKDVMEALAPACTNKSQEGDEVEVRLSREEAHLLHTFAGSSQPPIFASDREGVERGREKLRTALEEEGR